MKADFHKSNGVYVATIHYFDNEGKNHFTYSLADTSKEELIKKAKCEAEGLVWDINRFIHDLEEYDFEKEPVYCCKCGCEIPSFVKPLPFNDDKVCCSKNCLNEMIKEYSAVKVDEEYLGDGKYKLTSKYDPKQATITCDICGKVIIGVDNFIDAGDKVVCSEECKQKAIGKFFVENSLTSEERNGMLISYKDRLWAGKE